MVNADGKVEVPRWRHALINIAHPLLKQGLVILDTPGLNAIGAEPELTVNLIPQAHAVVFILAADTGVTKSDLSIWREHLITEEDNIDSRLVVLNKIDTMWDSLSTPVQVQAQIDRQRATSAEILGLPREQVIPVSAQKGLVAKVNDDKELLQASQLPVLERALSQGVMGQRQKILRTAVSGGIAELRVEAGRAIHIRRRDLAEQMLELKGLRGKNTSVIKHMRSRIEQEQGDFDVSGARIHAVRSVHLKLLREVFTLLGTSTLKKEMAELTTALRQPGIKLGVKKAYSETFNRLRAGLRTAQATSADIQSMLTGTFRQLNAEYGFSLQAPREPDLARYDARPRPRRAQPQPVPQRRQHVPAGAAGVRRPAGSRARHPAARRLRIRAGRSGAVEQVRSRAAGRAVARAPPQFRPPHRGDRAHPAGRIGPGRSHRRDRIAGSRPRPARREAHRAHRPPDGHPRDQREPPNPSSSGHEQSCRRGLPAV